MNPCDLWSSLFILGLFFLQESNAHRSSSTGISKTVSCSKIRMGWGWKSLRCGRVRGVQPLVLEHAIENDIRSQLHRVFRQVAFTIAGILSFQGTTDVVAAVDHGVATIQFNPFQDRFCGTDRQVASGGIFSPFGGTAFQQFDVAADLVRKNFVRDGNSFEFLIRIDLHQELSKGFVKGLATRIPPRSRYNFSC